MTMREESGEKVLINLLTMNTAKVTGKGAHRPRRTLACGSSCTVCTPISFTVNLD